MTSYRLNDVPIMQPTLNSWNCQCSEASSIIWTSQFVHKSYAIGSILYDKVATLQSSSNSPTFPGIQTGLRVILSKYCGIICDPSCACMSTFLNSTPVPVYLVIIATAVAQHSQITISRTFPNFPDFSLTDVKFPDFVRFPGCPDDCHPESKQRQLHFITDWCTTERYFSNTMCIVYTYKPAYLAYEPQCLPHVSLLPAS